jgi:multidrug efflux system membrane fusion protein
MKSKLKRSNSVSRIIGFVIIAAAAGSVFLIDWKPEVEEEPMPVRPLKTVEAGRAAAGRTWKYPGKTSAGEEATMAFEVAGSVKELLVREGDAVKKGQVLARLDDRDYQSAVKSAEAEVKRAEAQRERVELAAASNAVSKQEVSNARAAADKARADLEIRKKALEDTEITARFGGTIARTFIKAFENVQAKQAVLSLQNLSRIEIKASIPEARLALVDPVRRAKMDPALMPQFVATFEFFQDRLFALQVKELSTQADPTTQTYTATFDMKAPGDVTILPGMTAMVSEKPNPNAPVAENGILRVPLDAVPVDGEGQYYVWLMEKGEGDIYAAKRSDVQVGEIVGDQIEINSGLTLGQRIAAAGVHILVEGQQVRLLEETN